MSSDQLIVNRLTSRTSGSSVPSQSSSVDEIPARQQGDGFRRRKRRRTRRALCVLLHDACEHEDLLKERGDGLWRMLYAPILPSREADCALPSRRVSAAAGATFAMRSTGTFAALFPTVTEALIQPPAGPASPVIPGVTLEELRGACTRIRDGAAPGPDGVPNRALKLAVTLRPEAFLRVYSACLSGGVFPSPWKTQRLVLLPKPGRPPDASSSYRPLCMLDTAGKILERIICRHLEVYTEGASRSISTDSREEDRPSTPSSLSPLRPVRRSEARGAAASTAPSPSTFKTRSTRRGGTTS
ncbi:unnamed protein product [Trichogramma brassicae]|uniref:Reverse transcriptase domain-containing protein n=1 Tax=Trichogramma brassicae TaxID=86971 RepID=A0A6H5HY49_9HYME|nr:unnamed protein product [Trichogramma brassicae]